MNEKQTFSQFNEQLHGLPEIHSERDTPTILVRRSDETISTGNVYGVRPDGKYIVRVEKDGQDGTKTVAPEALSDQMQGELAAELAHDLPSRMGDVAVSAFEPVSRSHEAQEKDSVVTRIEELTRGLSQADKEALDRYARYDTDKKNAQESGDGEWSIRAGQYAGQEYRKLSPAAQSIVNQYAVLWRRR